MQKFKVLFLCTGNSCRSIMAEALLRHDHGDRFEVSSAGVDPKGVNPLTLQVLEELDIDTTGLRSKSLKDYLGLWFGHYLIFVCKQAEETCPRTFPGTFERISWQFEDPAAGQGDVEERLEKFREVCGEIRETLDAWVAQLEAVGKFDHPKRAAAL